MEQAGPAGTGSGVGPGVVPGVGTGVVYARDAIQLVRTLSQTHLSLSQMADQKASILMGANFLVFTISVGQAARGSLPLPLLVMACTAFVSAVCAVLAIMPAVRPPAIPRDKENILFFGVFSQVSEEEFASRVLESLRGDESLFRAMLRDTYQNGQVLQHKKYRMLRFAYATFLVGLGLTLMAFLAVHYVPLPAGWRS